jgi:RNA polymerase sigma-70 factor (ECF subfamily)
MELVDAIQTAGRERFGRLDVAPSAVAAIVDGRLAEGVADATLRAHAADIYLGVACIARVPAALAAFDREYIGRVPDVLAAKRMAAHAVDEIQQTVRERLLAGDPPYLATAIGRGSLAGLVAVIANRAALDWLRAHARASERDEPAVDDALAATGDPARDHLRARYAAALKLAFEAAIAELPARERTLLRLHLVDGLTIDDIARMYQIHRATAARQIERARDQVASSTRRAIARSDGVQAADLSELGTLIASQLDLSLSRVLATK